MRSTKCWYQQARSHNSDFIGISNRDPGYFSNVTFITTRALQMIGSRKSLMNQADPSLVSLHNVAGHERESVVLDLLRQRTYRRLLDIGTYDGELTMRFADAARCSEVYGTEILDEPLKLASSRGIKIKKCDINAGLPFSDGFFDVVTASSIIEHLIHTDEFVREVYRVLEKGGDFIVATENLSSWANVLSLVFGYQPLCQMVSSRYYQLGNPLSPRYGMKIATPAGKESPEWSHYRTFSYRAMIDFLGVHGFAKVQVFGAGYLPFKGNLSRILSRFDPRHSHFIIAKATK